MYNEKSCAFTVHVRLFTCINIRRDNEDVERREGQSFYAILTPSPKRTLAHLPEPSYAL